MMELSEEDQELCTQDERKCVKEMVKAMLVLDHSKVPFKQTDINKFLTKKPNRKSWTILLEQAKRKIEKLGLQLVEINSTSPKSYIVISFMRPTPSMYKFANEEEVADRTLLILILSFIFMKEKTVTKVDVFNHLKKLNIYDEEKPEHEYFGDIKEKVLKDFVRQMYLEKIECKETEEVELKWGARATAEVSKRSILEFVCNIGYEKEVRPENFSLQYQEVLEEENGVCDES